MWESLREREKRGGGGLEREGGRERERKKREGGGDREEGGRLNGNKYLQNIDIFMHLSRNVHYTMLFQTKQVTVIGQLHV